MPIPALFVEGSIAQRVPVSVLHVLHALSVIG